MKCTALLLALIFSHALHAKISIGPYRHSSWDNSWNESLLSELDHYENSLIMKGDIDSLDLTELNCPGYNQTSDIENRKNFWLVFLSALTRAESAFNVHAKSVAPKGGHGNYGLLQLSKRTAREQCNLNTPEEIADPNAHLRCGVKLLAWQLEGAPAPSGRLLRPDLKGQLFGKRILLWGPLRKNDKRGRKLLVNWFRSHIDQLSFCKV